MKRVDTVLIYLALMLSLGPAIGMVWVFYQLGIEGCHIVPDDRNILELYMAVSILILIVLALVRFIRYVIKGG